MVISLLSRFQGSLLGARLGVLLTENSRNFSPLDKNQGSCLQLQDKILKGLIDSDLFSAADWRNSYQFYSEQLNGRIPCNSSLISIGILPMALFYHDNFSLFREQLDYLQETWQLSPQMSEEIELWYKAIALILREQLGNSSLISELLKREKIVNPSLEQQLETLQVCLREKKSLNEVLSQLSSLNQLRASNLALACYYFDCSPRDFRLSMMRSISSPYPSFLTSVLTGILAGVYNGVSGIPILWRLKLTEVESYENLAENGKKLLAVWSGVDDLSSLPLLKNTAIASGGIIQPRPYPRVISQREN